MRKKQTAVVYRLSLSAVVVALYFVVMLCSAEFSFGIYQIRVATALYALALPFPFLVLPLGIANCLSNVLGGMAWDIAGGFLVGILTAGVCAVSGKLPGKLKFLPVFAAIELAPALVVPLWLAPALGVPYWALAASLLIGQLFPAAAGALLVLALEKRFRVLNLKAFGMKPPAKAASGDCAAIGRRDGTDARARSDAGKSRESFIDPKNPADARTPAGDAGIRIFDAEPEPERFGTDRKREKRKTRVQASDPSESEAENAGSFNSEIDARTENAAPGGESKDESEEKR